MRFHTTIEFQNRKNAWKAAYAAHDLFASAGDDNSPDANAASDLEYETLKALVTAPASTPTEIAEKLRIMNDRGIDAGWTDWFPAIMAQIDRDLREQQRPRVSPAMRDAFGTWREAYRAFFQEWSGNDADDDERSTGASNACCALMAIPCYTPGDFMVKIFVEMLGEHGAARGAFTFEIDNIGLTEGLGTNDGAAQEAFFRDLDDTDLGACLLALGQVEFDAAAWLAAADRVRMSVGLMEQADGRSGLWTGDFHASGTEDDPRHNERVYRVQRLLTGNGGDFGTERVATVCEYIRSAQPWRIVHATEDAA